MNEHRLQTFFFLFLVLIALVLNAFVFLPYFHVIFLVGIFAIVFKPLYLAISRKTVGRPVLASSLTVGTILVGILLPVILFGFLVFQEAQDAYAYLTAQGDATNQIREGLRSLEEYINRFAPNVALNFEQYLRQGLGWLVGHLNALFSGIVKMVFTFFLLVLGLFYAFKDGTHVKSSLIRLSPLSDEQDRKIISKVEQAIVSVVRGFLSVAIIQGVLTGIGFALFGVPGPVLWGLVASVAALIPGVGTALVIAPAILYLFFSGHQGAALGLFAWGVTAVGMIDNILGPILMRRGVAIHPFVILLSVLGGLAFFGPIGFLAGPVTVSLLITLFELSPVVNGKEA